MGARIDTLVRDIISNSKMKGEISLSDPVYGALMELRRGSSGACTTTSKALGGAWQARVVRDLFEYYLEHPEGG